MGQLSKMHMKVFWSIEGMADKKEEIMNLSGRFIDIWRTDDKLAFQFQYPRHFREEAVLIVAGEMFNEF